MNLLPLFRYTTVPAAIALLTVLGCQSEGGGSAGNGPNLDSIKAVQDSIALADSLAHEAEKLTVRYQMANPGPWVDSIMGTLSDDDKIAQLFCVAVYPYKPSNDTKMVGLLEKYKIGGIITMKGGPVSTANRINKYQGMSEVPLLVCTDAEWGVKMRLDSVERFPYQLTLGAMSTDEPVYKMGELIAKQHKRVGIHVNFAPVIDVNNNPDNPVIGMRSFGEDKVNVTNKGWAYSKGLQDNNVLAIGKHFPGHGDTNVDSHLDLPVIKHDMDRLRNVEFYPFRELISKGLGGIMTTHLYIPAIDSTPNLAAGLSKKAVTGLLREELQFDGLVFTDALNMSGVTKHFEPGDVDVRALLAGNDVLLMSPDIYTSIEAVKKAVKDSVITMEMVEQKVRKILAVKKWAGLDNYQPVEISGLVNDLNTAASDSLNQEIAEAAATMLYNKNAFLPLQTDTAELKIAVVTIGGGSSNSFHQELEAQGIKFTKFYMGSSSSGSAGAKMLAKVKSYDVVLVDVHANGFRPKNNYGISSGMNAAIKAFSERDNCALFLFCDAYGLNGMKGLEKFSAVSVYYQNTKFTGTAGARVASGNVTATGRFPVTLNDDLKVGMRAE